VSPDGGALAVWSPTGLSVNNLARQLGEELYTGMFVEGELVLGDIILRAYEGYADRNGPVFMLYIYNLLGDPATLVK